MTIGQILIRVKSERSRILAHECLGALVEWLRADPSG